MYGKGEGSKISMEFMMMHPNIVTAAIGYSWGAWLMPSEIERTARLREQRPGDLSDPGAQGPGESPLLRSRRLFKTAGKGLPLHLSRVRRTRRSHLPHPPSNDDALAWATRLRNKNIAPSAEEAKLLKAFSSAPPAPVDGYYPALALVGGAPAGAVLQKLFESKDANVRAAAAETCRHGIFGDATVAALAKLAADPSIKVRRSAVGALAMYANWRYTAAQQALIQLAVDKGADPLDRLNAADAIGYAVRLQVKGVPQDPPMFQALVSLLQDKEEPVRSTAAGTLAPLYESAGEGPQRRRAPDGGWEKWLNGITAQYQVTSTPAPGDLAAAFQTTLKAAEQGDIKAQAATAMLYANGKGVQQNYAEAGNGGSKLRKEAISPPPATPGISIAMAKA